LHLRRPQRGDFGWMVERHAQFDDAGAPRNEARAAGVVARYLGALESDARRIACWIAEHNDGARIGAALLSAGSESEARIELLFVEPGARRLGLGAQLVAACTGFAAEAGYESVSCAFDESHTDLSALFARAGFRPYGGAAPGVVWQRPLQSLYA
jgi:GNAT superfamily N-acetyltransferase